ncbi:MAG: asparagine synthase (glutamine-hydrolyzing) [Bacteroidetes bacterium]|nr:asparagine synthase (glutamine-hydrolyzing) [Bacteroidota bacterium]
MCGIAGIAGQVLNPSLLTGMMDKIAHRGPDGRAKWESVSGFQLGHLRLSIIDLSAEADQPMKCPVSGNVVVFNGEIYNYLELKKELSGFYPFKTSSDTEVMLAAYLKWGDAFLSHLRGMFAFALFDLSKNSLLLARDRFGIKPLYFRNENGYLLFGSEIKALLNVNGLSHSVNELKVLEFMCSRQLDCDDQTLFSEIRQLRPATWMKVNHKGEITGTGEYWTFPDQFGTRNLTPDVLEEFRSVMNETTDLHLRSDVPVGAFVSGGLDSSMVASLAARRLPDGYPLNLYSSVLGTMNQHEENRLIPLVRDKIKNGINHDLLIDDQPFLDDLYSVVYHHDEPIGDGSMYAHYLLCRMARENGVKVLLSGSGGDEVFGGYPSHTYSFLGSLARKGHLATLGSVLNTYKTTRPESSRELVLRTLQEFSPVWLRKKQKISSFTDMVSHLKLKTPLSDQKYYYYNHSDPWMANYLNCFKSWTIPPFLHYEDRNSMAFGVETRVPILDHEVIKFAFSVSPQALVGIQSKGIIRQGMRGIVPEPVLDQKIKHGFPAPLHYFLTKNISKTRSEFESAVRDVPFLDEKECRKIADNYFESKNPDFLPIFWRTFSLGVWYQIFFNGKMK